MSGPPGGRPEIAARPDHSCRRASIGFSSAALAAGIRPKTTPVPAEMPKPSSTAQSGTAMSTICGCRLASARDGVAQADAQPTAEQAQGHGLGEELQQDVAPAGADGLAQADLAGPLGDAHEHHVHDPDAADQQRDADDPGQHGGRHQAHVVEGFEDLVLGADLEVVRLVGVEPVPAAQEVDDLGAGLGDGLLATSPAPSAASIAARAGYIFRAIV